MIFQTLIHMPKESEEISDMLEECLDILNELLKKTENDENKKLIKRVISIIEDVLDRLSS